MLPFANLLIPILTLNNLAPPFTILSLNCLSLMYICNTIRIVLSYPRGRQLHQLKRLCIALWPLVLQIPFISKTAEVSTFPTLFSEVVSDICNLDSLVTFCFLSWNSFDFLNIFFKFAYIKVHSVC